MCTQDYRRSWRAFRIGPDIRSVQAQLKIVSGGLILIAQFSVSPQSRLSCFCSVLLRVLHLSVEMPPKPYDVTFGLLRKAEIKTLSVENCGNVERSELGTEITARLNEIRTAIW